LISGGDSSASAVADDEPDFGPADESAPF